MHKKTWTGGDPARRILLQCQSLPFFGTLTTTTTSKGRSRLNDWLHIWSGSSLDGACFQCGLGLDNGWSCRVGDRSRGVYIEEVGAPGTECKLGDKSKSLVWIRSQSRRWIRSCAGCRRDSTGYHGWVLGRQMSPCFSISIEAGSGITLPRPFLLCLFHILIKLLLLLLHDPPPPHHLSRPLIKCSFSAECILPYKLCQIWSYNI